MALVVRYTVRAIFGPFSFILGTPGSQNRMAANCYETWM